MLEKALRKGREWLEKLPIPKPRSEATVNRAEDAVVGALDLMEAYAEPRSKLSRWIAHKKHRAPLTGLQPEAALWTKSGRRACLELLALAESEMGAIAPFRPELPAGVLPIPKARTLSEAHKAALVAGRQRVRDEAAARVKRRRDWETAADRQNRT